ncbi:hypothetical protein [Spirosoma gilvum]
MDYFVYRSTSIVNISCFLRRWHIQLLFIISFATQAQSRVFYTGTYVGIVTFRDPTTSDFRYVIPATGVSFQRLGWTENQISRLSITVGWGQLPTAGRFFQRVTEGRVAYQKLYALSPAFQLGWQSRFGLHIHYDQFKFTPNRGQHLGGNVLLEVLPVADYHRPIILFGRSFRFAEQVSLPLLTGALGGTYSGADPYVGLTLRTLTNTLSLETTSAHKPNWAFTYQWMFTQLGANPMYQQQAFNGILFSIIF